MDHSSDSEDSLEDAIHSFTADIAVAPATYWVSSSANMNDDSPGPFKTFVMNCENVSPNKFMAYTNKNMLFLHLQ